MTVLSADRPATRGKRAPSGDTFFRFGAACCASIVLILLAGMLVRTTWAAMPAFRHSGIGFVTGNDWNPNVGHFGGLSFIYGTLLSSIIALVLAVPVSVLIAVFLSEVAPPRIATPLGYVVDLLAAVPSVVYGLWGVFVLVPFLAQYVWQPLSNNLGFIPLFSQFASGRDFATAGLILALMITPIISAVCREVFRTVPADEREAALALGATRWEMIRMAVLPRSRSGLVAAVMLGFGRAVGETIAVAYLIGGVPNQITGHLFHQGSTVAANIALQFNEAASVPLFKAALIGLGVVLFVITLIINVAARLIIRRGEATA
ncbi:MAG TPA: phosphate ABC transporter permease subunit PstC [Streptosporangiaceae bacterium]|nr:phosphate ABC transporter permease subunit PstC [Streptosporangiaceae bacterium]